eukprot:TRINITY_DN47443_c0_g1_i1.p1 TRINITY_DN47443_c0_g1~~TRINITY_DN47443_c0_g1_i1.p1  ORF type:complete len:233 (+),score=77.19 TRINITY_DN47443_c0_g1_i1:78-701(+)
MSGAVEHHPSALRNRGPITDALRELQKRLPEAFQGSALEIASGSGAHVEVLAPAFPSLQWQPTEADQHLVELQRKAVAGLTNVSPPLLLDATADPATWPGGAGARSLVYASNVTHISPWAVTLGLIAGAGYQLRSGGALVLYGPFKVGGKCTTESNAAFDASLRQRDPSWGYRDVGDISAAAAAQGLRFVERRDMPANNFMLVYTKG